MVLRELIYLFPEPKVGFDPCFQACQFRRRLRFEVVLYHRNRF
jgi:hypothetical protein